MFWILGLVVIIIYWVVRAEEESMKRRARIRREKYRKYRNL